MPRFQLPIAIALVTSIVTSLITFYFTRTKEGKIQLPTTANGPNEHDIYDVLRPEDVTDGYPIDEESFWTRVCWRDASILQTMFWSCVTRCEGWKLFCHCFLLLPWWSLQYHWAGLSPTMTMLIWKSTVFIYFLLSTFSSSQHVPSSKSRQMIIQIQFYTSLRCWLSHSHFWVRLQYCQTAPLRWQHLLMTSPCSWACGILFSAYTLLVVF